MSANHTSALASLGSCQVSSHSCQLRLPCLQAQRQLQLKLLAHGEFIQKLIRGESGKLGSDLPSTSGGGGGSGKDGTAAAPSNASPHSRKSKPAHSSGGGDNSGGGGGSSRSKRPLGGKQGSGASKPSGSKKGSREQLQRSSSGTKAAVSTTHLMLAPGQAHLEPASLPRRGSAEAAAGAAGMLPMLLPPGSPPPLLLAPPAAAQHALAQIPQQAQQQVGGASFQVDPAEVLARLAHGMPIAQMELAALLSPTSPLTQAQVRCAI